MASCHHLTDIARGVVNNAPQGARLRKRFPPKDSLTESPEQLNFMISKEAQAFPVQPEPAAY